MSYDLFFFFLSLVVGINLNLLTLDYLISVHVHCLRKSAKCSTIDYFELRDSFIL